jgi:hypothetical protein
VATDAPTKAAGIVEEFWITNHDLETWNLVEMKLQGVSEHAYFWVDVDRDPDPEKLQNAIDAFEGLYQQVQAVFGLEDIPGIDGDPHIYLLHPAATKLCNVSEAETHNCTVGGYFFGINQFPAVVFSHSNEHEGIIINYDGYVFGGGSYTQVLGHEYRHLIEYFYDAQSETWEAEGGAMIAMEILGFGSDPIVYANYFMEDPDVQLNAWATFPASLAHYGQGYVFHRYIISRFGQEFYTQWVQDPDGGFYSLTKILAANGFGVTAEDVWFDWLVTLVLFQEENASEIYSFSDEFGIDPVGDMLLTGLPRTIEDNVHQYAADIYRIKSESEVSVTFTGTTLTRVLSNLPPSGNYYWYSGRAAGAFPKLTRTLPCSSPHTTNSSAVLGLAM